MKTEGIDISSLIQKTCQNLSELNSHISEGAHTIEREDIESILKDLNKQSNELSRSLSQSTKINKQFKIEKKLEDELHKLIKALLHSGAFSQALGPLHDELKKLLSKIEHCVAKWQSKVEKVDSGPL